MFSASCLGAQPLKHVVAPKDNLWQLAGRYYNDHYRWRVIAEANTGVVQDPHLIYPDQELLIPELPARAKVEPAQAEPEPPVAAAEPAVESAEPEPEPEPAPPPAQTPTPMPARLEGEHNVDRDGLSSAMPPSQSGQFPSNVRVKVDQSWKADGKILSFGEKHLPTVGEDFVGKANESFIEGERLIIYRRDGARENDQDQNARYFQRVGRAKVEKHLKGRQYRFLILNVVDGLQEGDLLKRE